jgi:hypothetical protein
MLKSDCEKRKIGKRARPRVYSNSGRIIYRSLSDPEIPETN